MFATTVIAVMCTAGIAFYVRFLVELRRKCKPRFIGYWVRLRRGSSENTIAELQERNKTANKAA